MGSVFVAGTDTDVGKTVVAAALVSLARAGGIDAVPMKPIQSGCEYRDGELYAPDLSFVLDTNGIEVSNEELQWMCPCKLELPCSPHLAAEKAGCTIETGHIMECFNLLEKRHEMVVVEGAGGLLVPVNERVMMIDIIKLLNLPVVLVSRPGLGTLNHTLLSLKELHRREIAVTGVIFCKTQPGSGDYIEKDNKETIARLGEVTILGTVPYIDNVDSMRQSSERFQQFCKKSLPDVFNKLEEF